MRGGVGELVWPGDIAAGVDVGIAGLQIVVDLDGAGFGQRNAEFFQAEAADAGFSARRAEQHVERQRLFSPLPRHDQALLAIDNLAAHRIQTLQQPHAIRQQTGLDQRDGVGVLLAHDARARQQRDLAADAGEGLCQFAADRAAAQHQQTLGFLVQRPDRVRGDMAHRLDAGNLRDHRRRAGGDDDGARGQGLPALPCFHFHAPRRGDAGVPLDHFHAELAVALDRIMRLDLAHHVLDARHDPAEIGLGAGMGDTQRLGFAHRLHEARAADQRLRRHAAIVEAVAAHPVAFDQRHFRLYGGGDIGRHQTAGAGADHHQISFEARRFVPAGIHLARLHDGDEFLRQQREDAEQREGTEQRRRKNAGQAVQFRQLRAGVHEHQRAGQHADLAHPVVGAGFDRSQPHQQIDHEEREKRHQTQREQVEGAILGDAGVDGGQPVAEAALHPVAQQQPRREKSQRGANARRERDHQQPHPEPEQRAAGQRHHHRAGQRQRGDRDVDQEVNADHRQRRGLVQGGQTVPAGLQRVQRQPATQIESEVRDDQRRDEQNQQDALHAACSMAASCNAPPQLLPWPAVQP